jgi:hypothetical protein
MRPDDDGGFQFRQTIGQRNSSPKDWPAMERAPWTSPANPFAAFVWVLAEAAKAKALRALNYLASRYVGYVPATINFGDVESFDSAQQTSKLFSA